MLQHEPTLVGHPFVLQARDPRRGLIVAVASPLARQLGIAPGMSISEANSLAHHPRAPQRQAKATPSESTTSKPLLVLEHDPQEDIETLCWLAEAAQCFSPIVGLESLDKHLWSGRSLLQPQAILLDTTGLANFWGDEKSLACSVRDWLQQQGYLSCVAIADSVGAAWALANYQSRFALTSLLLTQHQVGTKQVEPKPTQPTQPNPSAATASVSWNSPSPHVVQGKEETQLALGPLAIESLRLDTATIQALKRLGLERIEQLMQLPRQGLASRLGTSLIQRIDQAWLSHPEPIVHWESQPEFAIEFSLEHPTNHRATIEEILRRLTQDLCLRLQKRGQGALRMLCRMEVVEHPALVMQLGLFRATAEPEHLRRLLLGQWERQWERGFEVSRLTLQANLTEALTWQQPELFEADHVRHRETAARLIDGLSSRLGRRSVVAPTLHRDPQPELACSWRPLTGLRNNGEAQETRRKLKKPSPTHGPQIEDPLRRPLTLLQPPSPLDIISPPTAPPTTQPGPPMQFRWERRSFHVVRYWGAERIESGWWRGPSQRRDYYRVETNTGTWLWLFQQRQDGQWFVHGIFE